MVRIIVLAVILIAGGAAAQENYVEAHSAYRNAMAGQDFSSALEFSDTAWRMAENELGEDPTTAILAFNTGWLVTCSPETSSI